MELVMDKWQRRMVGTITPGVIMALALIPWVATWGDLPDPIANHFDVHGRANGHVPLWFHFGMQLVMSVGSAGWLAYTVRRPRPHTPVQAGTATFVGILTGALSLSIAMANRGHAAWQTVTLENGAIAGALMGALGYVLPIALMARTISPPPPVSRVYAVPFAPDDRVAWFGHTRSVGFGIAGATNVVIGLVLGLRSGLWVGLVLIGIGIVLGGFASVTVHIDDRGIAIRSGLLGWPTIRFPLSAIESASAIDVRPTGLGGWGYRGSLRWFGRAAWVLRAGPGLELKLHNVQRLVVTIDDADEAAAVLNGLLARRAHASQ